MDLSDALGDWPAGGGNNPTWPGQPGTNPTWPGGQPGTNPTWPGGQPGTNPTWPGGQPAPNPTWPGGPSGGGGMWPGGNPSQPTAPGGFGPGPAMPTAPQKSLAVPYYMKLPQGVHDKLLITISGTIKPNAEKITLDFATSNNVAFHFNPRFNESGKKVIVRNSCINGQWGKEERELKNFPFVPGQPFEIKILCTNKEFKVAVNNNHLLEFPYRVTNLRSIENLNIYYDLNLSDVRTETLP
ncbi:galectin-3b [Austrofundulus limnaeus]|uniref:Galectin n=1 Tax=Austrofundulus limnaeus TaxID=52670 RepID=A0A2I4CC43_AUSLI|nr:PREDICTED: galectin-3-like [Austrofundulus limnaeus]